MAYDRSLHTIDTVHTRLNSIYLKRENVDRAPVPSNLI